MLGLKKQLVPVRPDFLEVTRDSVAVNESAVCSDLTELESALAEGAHLRASEILLEIGGKALLGRLDFGEAFGQWLTARRAQVEQRLKVAVEEALAELRQKGDDCDNKCDNKCDYKRAHARLSDAWRLRAPGSATGNADTRTRIGVLPFQPMDADSGSCAIAQGLFDELVTTLGQVPQLRVAGRGSSLNLARSERPLHEVARALHVAYLVQGSVQRQGEEVRVHVCLVDGSSGFESWSHGYRGNTGNVFALQADIARAVSRELGSALALRQMGTVYLIRTTFL